MPCIAEVAPLPLLPNQLHADRLPQRVGDIDEAAPDGLVAGAGEGQLRAAVAVQVDPPSSEYRSFIIVSASPPAVPTETTSRIR